MNLRQRRWVAGLMLAAMLTGGCSQLPNPRQEAVSVPTSDTAVEVSKPSETVPVRQEPSRESDELRIILENLQANLTDFEREHGVKIMVSGLGKDHIMMILRRFGDVDRPFSDEDKRKLKEGLYELVGWEFPLQMSFNDCCKPERSIEGNITSVDKEGKRVLIINEQKKNGNTDDPEATWVSMTDDGKIVLEGELIGFERLSVGQEVRMWSTGLMLQSYPGQTQAVKLEVLNNI